jgi:hypothetical protein
MNISRLVCIQKRGTTYAHACLTSHAQILSYTHMHMHAHTHVHTHTCTFIQKCTKHTCTRNAPSGKLAQCCICIQLGHYTDATSNIIYIVHTRTHTPNHTDTHRHTHIHSTHRHRHTHTHTHTHAHIQPCPCLCSSF